MDRKTDKHKTGRRGKVTTSHDTSVEESLLIRQRLRNLCELAIAIGQKQGLLGNHRNNDTSDLAEGQNVPSQEGR